VLPRKKYTQVGQSGNSSYSKRKVKIRVREGDDLSSIAAAHQKMYGFSDSQTEKLRKVLVATRTQLEKNNNMNMNAGSSSNNNNYSPPQGSSKNSNSMLAITAESQIAPLGVQ